MIYKRSPFRTSGKFPPVTHKLRMRWWNWGFRSIVMLYFVILIALPVLLLIMEWIKARKAH